MLLPVINTWRCSIASIMIFLSTRAIFLHLRHPASAKVTLGKIHCTVDMDLGKLHMVFINGGIQEWLVYKGKPQSKIGDDWGYPYFRKPPYHIPCLLVISTTCSQQLPRGSTIMTQFLGSSTRQSPRMRTSGAEHR